MNKTHEKVAIMCSVAGVLLLMPLFLVMAETNSVTNTVSSSASSGGNSAQGGEVVEGTTSADIFIETVVNGKVVEFINEHVDNVGEGIQKETFYEDDTVEVTTKSKAAANKPELRLEAVTFTKEVISNTEENAPEEAVDGSVGISTEIKFSFSRFFSQIMAYVFNIFTK